MWLVRELVRLVARIALATAIALVLAVLLALVSSHGFTAAARILTITIGCVLLALAGVGRGSNIERYSTQNVTKIAWGVIPGFDGMRPKPEDPTLAPGAVFFVSGLALIALGVAVF